MATDPTGRISHIPEMHRGFSWKPACRAATTATITISTALNNGDTLDGVTLATGDRVLVKDQSSASQNGIYIVGATPTRAADMDQDGTTAVPAEEIAGAVVFVISGTTNTKTIWYTTNAVGGTVGSTSIVWSQFTGGASSLTVKDEGSNLDTAVTSLDFVGAGVTATNSSHAITVTIPGAGSGSASAPAVKAFYAQHATNGTSDVVTITAASSGDRIILVTSSRGRDVNTPTCTNTTFTEVLAVNFSTTIYLSVYVGVVAGGSSGTTITTTATGSNWIIQDAYVVNDALTPTAGASATLTNTSASAVASTLVGPITCSVGDFFVFAATDDDGTTSITDVTTSSSAFSNPLGTNVALRSAIGRAGGTSIVGYYTGGTAGSDLAAGVIAIT